ncbi:hypothetical protein DRJ48_03175 [Candidatus Woesearchaeota archaeon]|nr:MAG: hypothetical protein DRJ48_03175 [Candidatus Woesearchaeota archaeon]
MVEKTGRSIKVLGGRALFYVNPEIFGLDAVLNAAYVLTDRAYIVIDGDIDKELIVEIKPKGKANPKKLALEFGNELISAQVYITESENNAEITEAIVKEALAGLSQSEEEQKEDEQ